MTFKAHWSPLVIGRVTLPYNILMRKHLLRLSAVRLLMCLDYGNTSWSFYIGLVGDLALVALLVVLERKTVCEGVL